ncbi:MAG: GldG family protein [Pseudomonadota bacterium]
MSLIENLSKSRLIGLSVALAVVLFLSVNVIASNMFTAARSDLTESGLYSLSHGTKNLLAGLKEPLHMRFYLSENLVESAPQLSAYAKRVRSMLETYQKRAGSKITLEVVDPKPFSDAEDRAVGLGINRIQIGGGRDPLFFGLAVTNSTDGKANIPVFAPDREAFLEYDLTRLIAEVGQSGKPIVAVLDGLGVAGNPLARQPQQHVMAQLQEVYTLEVLRGEVDAFPENTRVVMVIHPQNLSDRTLYALDQWILKGGATMVFVDPYAENQAGPQPGAPPQNPASDLPRFFKAWGVEYDSKLAVADVNFALRTVRQVGQQQLEIANLPWLSLNASAMDKSDAILSQLNSIVLTTAGSFKATGDGGVLKPLLVTTKAAGTIDAAKAGSPYTDPRELYATAKQAEQPLVLAGRLTGKLKSAFPDGKPTDSEAKGDPLKESTGEANVILAGDADMLMDRNWVQNRNLFGRVVAQAFANNGDLVLNAVEQMAGGVALADLRGRGVSFRPFEKIAALEKEADQKFRAKEQELVTRLRQTEDKLKQLGAEQSKEEGELVSEESVAAVEQFRADLLSTRAQLRNVQHDLRRDVDRLKTWITAANVGLIPAIIAAIALMLALRRPRRSVPRRQGASG